jgi:hypothetical protein
LLKYLLLVFKFFLNKILLLILLSNLPSIKRIPGKMSIDSAVSLVANIASSEVRDSQVLGFDI